jgi:hypothetical protein
MKIGDKVKVITDRGILYTLVHGEIVNIQNDLIEVYFKYSEPKYSITSYFHSYELEVINDE